MLCVNIVKRLALEHISLYRSSGIDGVSQVKSEYGDVMELADVADSKSADSDIVWVRLPPSPPQKPRVSAMS